MNILDSLKGLVTDELVSKTATALGEEHHAISQVTQAAIPTILAGLLGTDKKNYSLLSDLFKTAGIEEHLTTDAVAAVTGNGVNPAGGMMDTPITAIFAEKANGIINIVTNLGKLKSSQSAHSVLGMMSTVAASFFGKKMVGDGDNFDIILSMIGTEKDAILAALPEGVTTVLGVHAGPWVAATDDSSIASTDTIAEPSPTVVATEENTNTRMKWLWPLLLLAALAVGLLYVLNQGGCNPDEANTTVVEENVVNTNEDTAIVEVVQDMDPAGTLDEEGNWIVKKGDSITIKLDNSSVLQTTKGSVIEKLFQFVTAPDAIADKMKAENWFNFEDVFFKTGSANLKTGAEYQLQNAVEILNAFPHVKVKIGGYTDTTGNEEANLKLSAARAKAVYNKMITMGAQKTSFAEKPYEGYGSQFPLCTTNDSEECKAQNRRIAIVVTEK